MSFSLFKRILKHHWLDLVACVALPSSFLIPNNVLIYFPIHLLVLFFVAPIWLIIRLSFHMYRLSEVTRREEVAITLTPAREYLRSQLKLPINMVLFSIIPGWLIFSVASGQFLYSFIEIIVMFLVLIGLIFPPLAGAFHLLHSLCLKRSLISIYLPFCYYLPFPIIVLVLPNIIQNGGLLAIWLTFSLVLLIGLLLACIILTFINWKRACVAYYTFE